MTLQPALFENIVSETVQHLQEVIKPKAGEEKVCDECCLNGKGTGSDEMTGGGEGNN